MIFHDVRPARVRSHWTCFLPTCSTCQTAPNPDVGPNDQQICYRNAANTDYSSHCNAYCEIGSCGSPHCSACNFCSPDYCASWCNQYTCGKLGCAGCPASMCGTQDKCNCKHARHPPCPHLFATPFFSLTFY